MENKTSLSGTWKLTGAKISCDAQIPDDFHSALLKNGLIKDPYYGFNEQDVQWVGQTDWTIEREFSYEPVTGARAVLELTEADTFFTVFVNGAEAGCGQNQFARHRFDITSLVKNGKNKIRILFESPEKKSVGMAETLPYPVPYMKYDIFSPDRNLARKCQCHGGWDWGPCLMVSGIYGEIAIHTVADGLFDSIKISYKRKKDTWIARTELAFDSFIEAEKEFSVAITGGSIEAPAIVAKSRLSKGKNVITAELPVRNPEVWRTSGELRELGLAENTLYTLTVSEKDSATGTVSEKRTVCFSTLKAVSEQDTDKDGSPGRSLYFENNGRKIFARGSNWIPADALPSRCTPARYEALLRSAADANQNCIRVWGGGIYEKEIFYELCDRLGIIVWQDCMFACSLYPVTQEFIAEVNRELDYQIPRLQSHACIGLWCGNNENFGALNWFKESREHRDRYLIDYDRLYNGVIGKRIRELDPGRIFWPSSPCAGPDDYGDNWHADSKGDMHFWSVWHEKKSFDAYLSIRPRFVSEFGYESFPSMSCIGSFADEPQQNFTSRLMEYHQRSVGGNSIILENFSRYFQFPSGFRNMLYLSQVQQAVAIRTAVDWWRSLRPRCMGALIWQLNDVWPCPSWSSLEYDGKWKLLHYESRKFFSDVYLPLFMKDGTLNACACNDTAESLSAELTLRFLRFDGSEYTHPVKKSAIIRPDSVKSLFSRPLPEKGMDEYFVLAEFRAKSASGKKYACTNTVFPALYKHCTLQDARISTEITERAEDIEITLTAQKPAFFVALDSGNVSGRFSDNMVTLLPEKPQKITFIPQEKTSLQELKSALTVTDLYSSYR